jgi:ApaG protein
MSAPSPKPVELEGLLVTVDRLEFRAQAQTSPDRPYCFIYYLTIHNDSDVAVTIRGRKWVVTADDGEITAMEGSGVVGQTPILGPGEQFTYNSYHLLRTKLADAEGAFLGHTADGRAVFTRIPKFRMLVPTGA